MKSALKIFLAIVINATAVWSQTAGLDPNGWRFEQPVGVAAPGLTRLDLPVETINASLPGMEDVRLLSPTGVPTPLIIETSPLQPPHTQSVKDFKTTATSAETILLLESGTAGTIQSIILETPAPDFIKTVRIETGSDGESWRELAKGQVIFRQRDGAARVKVSLPSAAYSRLKLTINDRKTPPLPFTGAAVEFTPRNRITVPHPISITKVRETPQTTVLTLNLGAANLNIDTLSLLVKDPVFSRRVHLSYSLDDHGVPRVQSGAESMLCRLPEMDGLKAESLDLGVARQIPVDQATLTIVNGDSPPLQVTGISAARQPVTLVFFAQEAGQWKLLTGQRTATRPNYDLSALDGELRSRPAGAAQAGLLMRNASYEEPPPLPAIPADGAGIDLAGWSFRKPVRVAAPGIIRLELDEDVLSHCQENLADLRLVQNGRQIPWLRSPSHAMRIIQPTMSLGSDPKRPAVSIWKLSQPHPGLPVQSLTCTSPSPLFERSVILFGNRRDGLGNTHRIQFGEARWQRQPGDQTADFSLPLPFTRLPEACFLETNNGDNPAIEITGAKFLSAVKMVVAKLKGADCFLYYGNDAAMEPNYDLRLVQQELLAATPAPATLGAVEILEASRPAIEISAGSPWLWLALGLVVAVLLWVVARMLPAASSTGPA